MDKVFWNNVYQTKSEREVSWFQELPGRSIEIINTLKLPKSASLIDIGGGRSKLAECLFENGFTDITVLDISDVALQSINNKNIKTMASNIIEAKFSQQFDLWHDRAVFHFLTNIEDQKNYIELLYKSLKPGGYFLIATFSKNGPKKCSGLEICQYDKEDLVTAFSEINLIGSWKEEHHTPFNTIQNFTYCLFKN